MSAAASPAPHPATDPGVIPDRVARLRATFTSGRTRPLAWRREQLAGMKALLRERGEELVAALQADLRKPALEAWSADVSIVVHEIELAEKKLARWTKPERVRVPPSQRPGKAWLVREPLGVVLVIGAWNYPVQLTLQPAAGALAAGNCVVIKPSEVTAHTSEVLARRVPEYLDPEAVAVVEGAVAETQTLLGERFDHVFYTGNGRVGRIVMEAAAKHLTPVTLELGGKSPCIVDRTARIDRAAERIAWGKFVNAGQTCIAPDYVLVDRAREPELVEALADTLRRFYGDPARPGDDLARIVSDRHFERLAKLLESGEVAVGGTADPSQRWIAPTVLRNVAPDAPAMQEEIFGPILPVIAVDDVDAAVRFVNERDKPLALYVFTEDEGAERRVVEGTSSGGVCVNATIWHVANPALPFGGVGESGMGAYHGRATFETFSHRKPVVKKPTRGPDAGRFAYPPYGKWKTRILRRML